LAGFRPGIKAAAERQALTPLLDAGLTKADVRSASHAWGLATWDKPAAACLSSRIAFGIEISPSRLARVERAESLVQQALSASGVPFRNLRVRDLGDEARIEIDVEYVEAAFAAGAVDIVRAAGFRSAYVDPAGFRSGSLNELLPQPERWR
ncbi:MAG: TIGR00268 family protein, partial [Mycobacteriales bacterium]